MLVKDKTIVVCGVGPGLGREVAKAALRDGANVVIAARRSEALAEHASSLDPTGDHVLPIATDVSDPSQCEALMGAASKRFGSVDAVVQVAALDALFGNLESTSAEDFANAVAVNITGAMQIAQAAVPHMKETNGGSIVLIGTQAMWHPPAFPQLAYAASKGGLLSAMYHLVRELGPDRIRVNMVIPTWMWGPPVEGFVKGEAKRLGLSDDEVIQSITKNMPLGEIPKDDDVANACIFFCSDHSRMITGETLLVNAGEILR
ncbi:MAG TPA: SDR family oxidoreductase [Myxococcales bacterium]|nr:SDR family oxidoreductase [Myxococcales bacterium]HIK86408.1 SDR family oxidoreductase [Myxococcales bacterium]